MLTPLVLAAAKPWTYWLAPPLLAVALVVLLSWAVVYYRRVTVPSYLWKVREQQRHAGEGGAVVAARFGQPRRPGDELGARAA